MNLRDFRGITYENGREHLLYRIETDAFYSIVLKKTGRVIGNIHFQKDENGLPKWKDTFVYAVLNNRRLAPSENGHPIIAYHKNDHGEEPNHFRCGVYS